MGKSLAQRERSAQLISSGKPRPTSSLGFWAFYNAGWGYYNAGWGIGSWGGKWKRNMKGKDEERECGGEGKREGKRGRRKGALG